MNLNFSKYSLYTFIAVLCSGYVACAMEEQDPPHTLKRTETLEPSILKRTKRVTIKRSETEKRDAAANDVKLSGMVRTRSQSQSQSQKEDTNEDAVFPIQRLPSTGSQGDSQRAYNIEFDSQTIKEARERYLTALAEDKSNPDTLDEADTNARKRQKRSSSSQSDTKEKASKVSFKQKISIRGCPNVLEEQDSQGQDVFKRTHSYHDYVVKKAPAEQERREQRRKLNERMEMTWQNITEIQGHPIFNHKFKRSISKIVVGFRKLTSDKNTPSTTEVLDNLTKWQESHLSLTYILRDLTKRFSTLNDIEQAMDAAYIMHTETLDAQKNAIITAQLFDTKQYSTKNDEDSDVESTVIDDDINGDTASTTSNDSPYYENMTEMEYFDSLITRYGEALTTLKNDLLRLQRKPVSKKDAALKRTSSKS